MLRLRNLSSVYKQTNAGSKWCLFSVDRLLVLRRMHQLKGGCQITQRPRIQELELIPKPSPRWPTPHIAHISLTQPTPLELNWATGSVITDGRQLWARFLVTQKLRHLQIQILPFEHEWDVPAKWTLLMHAGWTQVPACRGQHPSAYFGSRNIKVRELLSKGGVGTWEYLAQDSDALKILYLMHWKHCLPFCVTERQEGIPMSVLTDAAGWGYLMNWMNLTQISTLMQDRT